MSFTEAALAAIIGFLLGYILVTLLESSSYAGNKKIECYWDFTPVEGSALQTGWRCAYA